MTSLLDLIPNAPRSVVCPRCGDVTTKYLATLNVRGEQRSVMCWPSGFDPATGRCPACVAKLEHAVELARQDKAQAAAGVPPKYRGPMFRAWASRVLLTQGRGETGTAFVSRVKAMRESDNRVAGIPQPDLDALRAVARWKPEHGSMFLEGVPGTGKTLAACAVLNELVSRPHQWRCMCARCKERWILDDTKDPGDPCKDHSLRNCPTCQWEGLPYEAHFPWSNPERPLVRMIGPVAGRFQGETTLIASLKERIAEGDSKYQQRENALDACKRAPVLVLDDLGASNGVTDFHRNTMFALLDHRYSAGLPTIITSNLPLHMPEEDKRGSIALKYDDRLASRIKDMVGQRRYTLTVGWR